MVIFCYDQIYKMWFAAALIVVFSCLSSLVQAVELDAKLDRETAAAGEGALLTLTIYGKLLEQPELLPVENLVIRPQGQSKQVQTVDGRTTMIMSYTYIVGSQIPGEYIIPAIEMTVDGNKLSSKPLKLKVVDAGVGQPPAVTIPTPDDEQVPAQKGEEAGENQFGFLTVELADSNRKHAYVGEIAPVRIRAWLPAGAQANLRSGIQPEGKGFTLHNVSSQPQQTEEIKDGKRYTVVTWFGGISATKAGKLPASLSVDATVAIRDTSLPRAKRRRTGGPFDDPFFDSAFDRMDTPMVQKDVTLKSDDQEIEVRALPLEGRPAGFTGAIGDFRFDSAEFPSNWKTGEPQQITTRLSGSGNFSLMNVPALVPSDSWKTYKGKEEFNAGDRASFSGSKSFQFSAVARKGGRQDAALEFSYFDPVAELYKTIARPVREIQVSGNDAVEDKPVAVQAVELPKKKNEGMFGLHEKNTARRQLVPLVSRPAFVEILAVSGVFGILGMVLGFLRVRREDPNRLARVALAVSTREAIDAAGSAKDVQEFFSAARTVLQQKLGLLWNQPAQAITTAEINARIVGDSPITRFFQEADFYEYSRQDTCDIQPRWRVLFEEALSSITPSTR